MPNQTRTNVTTAPPDDAASRTAAFSTGQPPAADGGDARPTHADCPTGLDCDVECDNRQTAALWARKAQRLILGQFPNAGTVLLNRDVTHRQETEFFLLAVRATNGDLLWHTPAYAAHPDAVALAFEEAHGGPERLALDWRVSRQIEQALGLAYDLHPGGPRFSDSNEQPYPDRYGRMPLGFDPMVWRVTADATEPAVTFNPAALRAFCDMPYSDQLDPDLASYLRLVHRSGTPHFLAEHVGRITHRSLTHAQLRPGIWSAIPGVSGVQAWPVMDDERAMGRGHLAPGDRDAGVVIVVTVDGVELSAGRLRAQDLVPGGTLTSARYVSGVDVAERALMTVAEKVNAAVSQFRAATGRD